MNNPLLQQAQDVFGQFGMNGWLLTSQILTLAALGLPIVATVYCLRRHRSDRRLPVWLLLIWLVPIAGPLCTLLVLRKRAPNPTQP
jgi:Phospholipase_D-nuclease N-terminal